MSIAATRFMKFKVKSDSGYAQWQMEQKPGTSGTNHIWILCHLQPLGDVMIAFISHSHGRQVYKKRLPISAHKSATEALCASFVLLSSGAASAVIIECAGDAPSLGGTSATCHSAWLSSISRSPAPIIYGIWLCRRGVGEAAKRTRGAAKINLSLAARAIIIIQNIIQLRARAFASRFARSGVSLFTT
jgi:hypothetical protein